jgi:hypothetical protein
LSADAVRVDIAELTPEDRERVLRLLFAKINNLDSRPIALREREINGGGGGGGGGGGSPQLVPSTMSAQRQQREASGEHESKGEDGDGDDSFANSSTPFETAADFQRDLHHRRGVRGTADLEAAGEIDASELAAALGAKAQERIHLAENLRAAAR